MKRTILLLLPLALAALAGCQDRDLPTAPPAAPGGAPLLLQVPASNHQEVTAGDRHTCAVRQSDGIVTCWGLNDSGQTNVPAGLGAVTQVSAGSYHTCAVRQSDGTVTCWGWNGLGQTDVPTTTITIHPTATFTHPASVVAGQPFALALDNAQVPGHPEATSFTYAFDCGDGGGYGAFGTSHTASCPTSAAGTRTVKGAVRDQDNDQTEYTATVEVSAPPSGFVFSGFLAPVDNLPTVNVARAGGAIPVKFSLGGDQGLGIFASGYPRSQAIPCDTGAPQGSVEETVTAGSSSLSYDAATDRYTYVWKTEKSWGNSCRTLTLQFTDGTTQSASFKFTK
jgi:hypothetical protein